MLPDPAEQFGEFPGSLDKFHAAHPESSHAKGTYHGPVVSQFRKLLDRLGGNSHGLNFAVPHQNKEALVKAAKSAGHNFSIGSQHSELSTPIMNTPPVLAAVGPVVQFREDVPASTIQQFSNDPAYEAHVKSLAAEDATNKIDKRAMFSSHRPVSAREAVNHSHGQRFQQAAEAHKKAAEFHNKKAQSYGISYNRKQDHRKATELHLEAMKAHESMYKPKEAKKDYSKGITHEDTKIHNGVITHKGKEVGSLTQGLKNGYHPVHRLELKNGHKEDIELDAHKSMEDLAKHVHNKVIGDK